MIPKVSRSLNKIVLASVPVLFDDGACRPFTLLGAETSGLWLQSNELTQRLLPGDKQGLESMPPAVFIPFAQIAAVLLNARTMEVSGRVSNVARRRLNAKGGQMGTRCETLARVPPMHRDQRGLRR